MSQIILNDFLPVIETRNITFTAAEWAQYVAQTNADTTYFCYIFLGIGALIGALGIYIGIRCYNGRQG